MVRININRMVLTGPDAQDTHQGMTQTIFRSHPVETDLGTFDEGTHRTRTLRRCICTFLRFSRTRRTQSKHLTIFLSKMRRNRAVWLWAERLSDGAREEVEAVAQELGRRRRCWRDGCLDKKLLPSPRSLPWCLAAAKTATAASKSTSR